MGGVVYGIVEIIFQRNHPGTNIFQYICFSENGLPQSTKFLSHQLFTNCDVSRVFGSKSGCGVVACGMVWILARCAILAEGKCHWTRSALMNKNSFTADFLILWCEYSFGDLWGLVWVWGGCIWNGADFCPEVSSLHKVNVTGLGQP